ncbi:MAG: hypothetical protein IPP07_17755 [Holophagales bacterium]|nr:hypothetical protein [Holophagales bacterium]
MSSGLRQALGLDGGVEYPVQLKAIDLADESRPQIIVPLTPLENLDQLETLKKTLGRSSPGELFPHELTRSDLVRSGVVVDILLNELARNVFDHARGCPAFVALATNDAFSQSCTPWEASFRAAVQATTRTSTRYLALVVADCGQGLVKSLSRSAFYSTEVNSQPFQIAADAFEPYVSSKGEAERLAVLRPYLLDSGLDALPPATGLFWVKEACREFGALLEVRSGPFVLVWDFADEPHQNRPRVFSRIKAWSTRPVSLYPLSGVQVAVRIPLTQTQKRSTNALTKALSSDRAPSVVLRPGLDDDGPGSSSPDDEQGHRLLSVRDKITAIGIAQGRLKSDVSRLIAIDILGLRLDTKVMYVLGAEILRRQSRAMNLVLLNADSLLVHKTEFERLVREGREEANGPRCSGVIAFDSGGGVHFLGLGSDAENALLQALEAEPTDQVETLLTLETRYPEVMPLLGDDLANRRLRLAVDKETVLRAAQDTASALLKAWLQHEKSPAAYCDRWFLLPSRSYSSGFFEVRQLLLHSGASTAFRVWLTAELRRYSPTAIVTLGRVATDLLRDAWPDGEGAPRRISIPDPHEPMALSRVSEIPRNSRVAFFSDVIGSGRTIAAAIGRVPQGASAVVLTVVDARTEEDSPEEGATHQSGVEVRSILRRPLVLRARLESKDRAEAWEIDPDTHAPLSSEGRRPEAIRGDFGAFLNACEGLPGVLRSGHFTSGGNHLSYLFDFGAYLESGDSLGLVELLRSEYAKALEGGTPDAILYPTDSPGMRQLAETLAKPLLIPAVVGIEKEHLEKRRARARAERSLVRALVLDDAAGSGITIRAFVDLAARWGAERIVVIVLLNRCSDRDARGLEGMRRYGGAAVDLRFVFDANIPVYRSSDCPLCAIDARLRAIEMDARREGFQVLVEHIQARRMRNSPQLVAGREIGGVKATGWTTLARELELRRQLERARVNHVDREELVDLISRTSPFDSHFFALMTVLGREAGAVLPAQEGFRDSSQSSLADAVFERGLALLGREDELADAELEIVVRALRTVWPERFLVEWRAFRRAGARVTRDCIFATEVLLAMQAEGERERFGRVAEAFRGIGEGQPALWVPDAPRPPVPDLVRSVLKHLRHGFVGRVTWLRTLVGRIKKSAKDAAKEREARETLELYWDGTLAEIERELIVRAVDLYQEVSELPGLAVSARDIRQGTVELMAALEDCRRRRAGLSRGSDANEWLLEALDNDLERVCSFVESSRRGLLYRGTRALVSDVAAAIRRVDEEPRYQEMVRNLGIQLATQGAERGTRLYGLVPASELDELLEILVSNWTHAFEGAPMRGRRARVVLIEEADILTLRVQIMDNGRLDETRESGLGLEKARRIVQALNGEWQKPAVREIEGERWTVVDLRVPSVPTSYVHSD